MATVPDELDDLYRRMCQTYLAWGKECDPALYAEYYRLKTEFNRKVEQTYAALAKAA
jgi:hypothetical protein